MPPVKFFLQNTVVFLAMRLQRWPVGLVLVKKFWKLPPQPAERVPLTLATLQHSEVLSHFHSFLTPLPPSLSTFTREVCNARNLGGNLISHMANGNPPLLKPTANALHFCISCGFLIPTKSIVVGCGGLLVVLLNRNLHFLPELQI